MKRVRPGDILIDHPNQPGCYLRIESMTDYVQLHSKDGSVIGGKYHHQFDSWDYEKGGWFLTEESIITRILEKYEL
jgi:hypothetical protein